MPESVRYTDPVTNKACEIAAGYLHTVNKMKFRDHNGRFNGGWGVGLCRWHGAQQCPKHGTHAKKDCNSQDPMTGREVYPTLTDEGSECWDCYQESSPA